LYSSRKERDLCLIWRSR